MEEQDKAKETIKLAEQWLKDNYATHPQGVEALHRYEVMYDQYKRMYGESPTEHRIAPKSKFDFNKAREYLAPKIPRLNKEIYKD